MKKTSDVSGVSRCRGPRHFSGAHLQDTTLKPRKPQIGKDLHWQKHIAKTHDTFRSAWAPLQRQALLYRTT